MIDVISNNKFTHKFPYKQKNFSTPIKHVCWWMEKTVIPVAGEAAGIDVLDFVCCSLD